jgi:hypothetical protein
MTHLIEPNSINIMKHTLKQCNYNNLKYKSNLTKWLFMTILIVVFGGTLYYRYQYKLSPNDKYIEDQIQHKKLVERFKNIQSTIPPEMPINTNNSITDLPDWSYGI